MINIISLLFFNSYLYIFYRSKTWSTNNSSNPKASSLSAAPMTSRNQEGICSEIFSKVVLKANFVLLTLERKKFKDLQVIPRWKKSQIPILPFSLLPQNIVQPPSKPWLKKKTQKLSSSFLQDLEKATNKEKNGKNKSQLQSTA